MSAETDRPPTVDASRRREELARLLAERRTEGRRYPLSFSQQRLWFLHQLSPANPFYNVDATVPMRGAVNAAALEHAINEIVRRHESLRTTFRSEDGEPFQVVVPELRIPLRTMDLRALPSDARDARVAELRRAEAQDPYDLERGPLVRTLLVRVADQEHLFLLGMHHIVCDGWSMGIFGRELQALYAGYVTGTVPRLPDLPIQYGDFAAWQRRWLSGERLETELAFWRSRLDGVAPLELPLDFPRRPVQRYRGRVVNLQLGRALTDRIHAFSRRQSVTLFITLLAAFKVLLHRYSGQSDIAVGTYIANRNRKEVEPLIGFFLNTLVLRTDATGDPTFRTYLSRVKDTAVDAYGHQDLPFETLVEHLHPARDLSRNPLFQVAFQLSNAPTQQVTDDVSWLFDSKRGATIFDLAFMLFETSHGLAGQFEYSTDLFREDTVEGMARHYRTLIEEAIERPDVPLSRLPLLSSAERERLLVGWNQTTHEVPYDRSVVDLFDEQVALRADQAAVSCGEASLTWRDIQSGSNGVARLLREAGVGPGTVVGVCCARSLDVVPVLLGVWKAGGVYLPLDPTYPRERLEYMVRDSGARLILAQPATIDHICGCGVQVLDAAARRAPAAEFGQEPRRPDDLAYIIYTSGSTGVPKGVEVPFRQVLNRLHWMWETYPFEPWDVSASRTALSFVDSLWELLGPLLRGSPTVIIPDSIVRDPRLLVGELATRGVTSLWIVPSLLATLLDAVPALGEALPRLRFWVSSGEPLAASLLERFTRAHPTGTLFNLYGTSETWDATWYDTPAVAHAAVQVPIGKPIWNVRTYVLDRHLEPQPTGVPGELFVAGDGLANGYVGDPARTAGRFVTLHFRANGERAYRTGDRARWLPDGNLELLGRVDDQVKVRGFRVEPAEVEAALLTYPSVRHAAVLVNTDGSTLAAFVASGADPLPTPSELRVFLQRTLPGPFVPSAFHVASSLPLTPSGKVDRWALRSPAAAARSHAAFVPPRDGLEQTIAAVWRDVLGVDRIGANDNFFDVGGHSLLATQVVSRLRKVLDIEVPVQVLFEEPSVAGLAGWAQRAGHGTPPAAAAIRRVQRDQYVVTRPRVHEQRGEP